MRDAVLYARTTKGLERIDVLYRRLDDDFLDPVTFRPDSVLGAAGLFHAYRAGSFVLANAPGTGVADDKAVYAYLPRIIRYFLDEEPILDNVETHLCREPEGLAHTLAHLEDLVVKEVGGSGGYGMLIGPHASRAERAEFADRIRANPSNFISQPTLDLSRAPCYVDGRIEPRHVDLRPFVLQGRDGQDVVPGGPLPGRLAQGEPRRQLEPGRRLQGPLGVRRLGQGRKEQGYGHAGARRRQLLLDGTLSRADQADHPARPVSARPPGGPHRQRDRHRLGSGAPGPGAGAAGGRRGASTKRRRSSSPTPTRSRAASSRKPRTRTRFSRAGARRARTAGRSVPISRSRSGPASTRAISGCGTATSRPHGRAARLPSSAKRATACGTSRG